MRSKNDGWHKATGLNTFKSSKKRNGCSSEMNDAKMSHCLVRGAIIHFRISCVTSVQESLCGSQVRGLSESPVPCKPNKAQGRTNSSFPLFFLWKLQICNDALSSHYVSQYLFIQSNEEFYVVVFLSWKKKNTCALRFRFLMALHSAPLLNLKKSCLCSKRSFNKLFAFVLFLSFLRSRVCSTPKLHPV